MLRPACWGCAPVVETGDPGVAVCEEPTGTGVAEPGEGCWAGAGGSDEETILAPSKTKASSPSEERNLIRTKFRTSSSIPNLLSSSRRSKDRSTPKKRLPGAPRSLTDRVPANTNQEKSITENQSLIKV
jgi:hypothetical protein